MDARSILDRVLNLPIKTWAYTNDTLVRHIGPMSQDFQAAFNLGSDDKHIASVDADGVALTAIQGLHEKFTAAIQEKDAQIAALKKELDTVKSKYAHFEARFQKLESVSDNHLLASQSAHVSSRQSPEVTAADAR